MTLIVPVIPKLLKMFFLQHEMGIEKEKKTNGTMTREKVPVFKGKCHSCLEKGHELCP